MAGRSSMSTLGSLLSRCALQQSQQGSALLLLPSPLRQLSSAAAAAAPAAEVQPGEVGGVSGIPEEQLNRRVLVYSPARVACQQGEGKTGVWKLRFPSTHKWENPLMGWTSTSDPLSYVGDHALTFDSKEAAIDFAKRHGWEPMAYEPQKPVKKPKSYAENFRWKGPPVQPE